MEGFWTLEFSGGHGSGGGVATLISGKVFGDDEAYIYTGTYTVREHTLTAEVHVKPFIAGIPSVLGTTDEFDLELSGNEMTRAGQPVKVFANGSIPGTGLTMGLVLTKIGDLPPRS